MKKTLTIALSLVLLTTLFISCGGKKEETKTETTVTKEATTSTTEEPKEEVVEDEAFHIGIVTGTVSQSEDDLRGAERLIEEYGTVAERGMIQHVTYPDNFMDELETTISVIAGLADDPMMKAVIVNQAIPGTTEAFRTIKEKRPDILCIAGEAHEDPGVIQSAADLAVNNNFVARGYLIINTAR